MAKRRKFTLVFAPEVVDHLDAVERKYHGLLRDLIVERLAFPREDESRNQKLLQQPAPFDATWELRGGPNNRFRVFYDVRKSENAVRVLAIGEKKGSRLFVGNEEVDP